MIMHEPLLGNHDEDEVKPFTEQQVDLTRILPLPDGFEHLFLALYFIIIPYVIGLLFIFLFIAKGNFSTFINLDIFMFIAVWAIGYEVCASIALSVIFYKMFQYNKTHKVVRKRKRARRTKPMHEVHDLEQETAHVVHKEPHNEVK